MLGPPGPSVPAPGSSPLRRNESARDPGGLTGPAKGLVTRAESTCPKGRRGRWLRSPYSIRPSFYVSCPLGLEP